jgi:hypothetical protein
MPEQIQDQKPTEKFVFEFQHTDRNGQPIIDPRTGKQAFTNLTGANEREVLDKLKESYLELESAYVRVRSQKPVPKAEQPAPKELSAEEERQAVTEVTDPVKGRAAIRKLAGVEDLEARQKATDEAKFQADANRAAYAFMAQHINDYYPCQANSAELTKYINENELDPRNVENYEVAFNAVEHKLAPRPAPPAPPAPPKIDEPPAAPPEKKASGGMQPGQFTGDKPRPRNTKAITRESINEMRRTAEGRAEYKKRMRDPEFVRQVNAAFQT